MLICVLFKDTGKSFDYTQRDELSDDPTYKLFGSLELKEYGGRRSWFALKFFVCVCWEGLRKAAEVSVGVGYLHGHTPTPDLPSTSRQRC